MSYAPNRKQTVADKPWEGSATRKPWDYQVTAAIPCLDTPETLPSIIELLRLQTERPFIVLIDTGSVPDKYAQIESLRAEDIDVHALRFSGVRHPSDFPAIAMDLAFSACSTPYLFATHADCFLRSRDVIAELLTLCRSESPVVGYELTERKHPDWRGMVGHTCTLFDTHVMDMINAAWSQRRLCAQFGISDHAPNPLKPNWPDTELLINYQLREHGIQPHLIGHETNFERTLDKRIDHCRTLTASKLYSPEYYKRSSEWTRDALVQAEQRIKEWNG